MMSLKRFFQKDKEAGISQAMRLKELSKVPLALRNLEWDYEFLDQLGEAKLTCKVPQLKKAPDGFTYFQMQIPDIGAPFQSYVAGDLIKDHLLADGHGIQVYSYSETEDRRLSYGELLNYHYRGSFRSKIKNWLAPSPNQFQEHQDIVGGNPSEQILLKETRKVLLAFFVQNGFHFPKVSHLNIMTEGGILNQLVFNIEPKMFRSMEHFETVLGKLSWFFPVHYTYTSVPEHYLGDLFYNL